MPRGTPDFHRPIREKARVSEVRYKEVDVDPGKTETLVDMPGEDITLEMLEFATNYYNMYLNVYPYKEDGKTLGPQLYVPRKDAVGFVIPTPYTIHENESIIWFELIYDTTKNYFKFGLGYSIRFGNGYKITVTNPDTVKHKVALVTSTLVRG